MEGYSLEFAILGEGIEKTMHDTGNIDVSAAGKVILQVLQGRRTRQKESMMVRGHGGTI